MNATMRAKFTSWALTFVSAIAVGGTCSASESLPELGISMASALKDPAGEPHSQLAVGGKVGVVIFSVPDMSQGPSQRRWSKILAIDPTTRLSEDVGFSLVENMALAGAFRDDARHEMQNQFVTKKRPLLLLDETGDTFKRFAILRDRTEILIFDRKGRLRDVEDDLDDREKIEARIAAVTSRLMRSE